MKHTITKAGSVVLTVVMLLAVLTGCGGGQNANSPFLGSWKSESFKVAGQTLTVEKATDIIGEDAAQMLNMTITFKEDGTADVEAAGIKGSSKWTEKDDKASVESNGNTLEFTIEDSKLVFEQSGATIYLVKS